MYGSGSATFDFVEIVLKLEEVNVQVISFSLLDGEAAKFIEKSRVNVSDFNVIKVIGRGAFGEVQLVGGSFAKLCWPLYIIDGYLDAHRNYCLIFVFYLRKLLKLDYQVAQDFCQTKLFPVLFEKKINICLVGFQK